MLSWCSWCVAQEVIDIAPDDVKRYYPNAASYGWGYRLEIKEEPIIILLRTDQESKFQALVQPPADDGELVLTNGWNTDCQLRVEYKGKTWKVSTFYGQIVAEYMFLTKYADRTKIEFTNKDNQLVDNQRYAGEDCLLESKRFGGRLICNLTFSSSSRYHVQWYAKTIVLVRLPEPSTTTEKPTTTTEVLTTTTEEPSTTTTMPTPKVTSKSSVYTQVPPSHSTLPNANDTTTSEASATGGRLLDPFFAAVVVMQLPFTFFLRA